MGRIDTYRVEVEALLGLLGFLHERQRVPDILETRRLALATHPHFTDEQRENAHFVLSWQDVTWSRVQRLVSNLRKLRKKALPVRILEVPAYNYESAEVYYQALRDYAARRITELTERDTPYQADVYQDRLRVEIDVFKRKGSGYAELVFESRLPRQIDRLDTGSTIGKLTERLGAVWLRSDIGTYEKIPKRREFTNVEAMQRASHQLSEGETQEDAPEPEPITIYYRAFIFYVPDPYFEAYAVWKAHGGADEAKKRFENLSSEFPSLS